MSIILQDKFLGCICGCHIGSAMGAPVEGMTYEEIDRKYGYVDGYLPYQHYGNGWDREPGTTEDGVERQKLLISAIMEKREGSQRRTSGLPGTNTQIRMQEAGYLNRLKGFF